ncbi:peptidyl-Lys metalloendopeptidase [Rhizoctonia solani]|uniref:Peptidyl-Lys metalloendopeptidase n=1 Tax=Rhizoctonia solani TaxID=456999 RepID=A0A8H7M2Y4_9AGAM|nr:peptidyl-Lys metalloendopeptidase [Rhizoctonia solani]
MISTASFGLALVSLWGAGIVSAAPSLTLSTFGPTSVSDVSALKITTSIKNTGTETLRLLNDPNSALSTWETDSFHVTRAESSLVASPALNFTGLRQVKYSPQAAAKLNKPELFTVIAPGATVNITHSLASTYDFSGKGGGAGKYKLKSSQRARTFLSIGADGTITPLEATEDKIAEVAVSGRLSGPKLQPSAKGAAQASGSFQQASGISKRALVRGCNNDQINQILTAADRANNMAHGATASYAMVPGLRGVGKSGSEVGIRTDTTWSGGTTIKFASTLPTFFMTALALMRYIIFRSSHCVILKPQQGIYAYVVIPGHFKEVYLCGAFWRAPMEGTDSKAGTIIHEASHFPEYAGTSDHAYGQGACRDLARNDPNRAAMNADSHEYFAENQPWLGQ